MLAVEAAAALAAAGGGFGGGGGFDLGALDFGVWHIWGNRPRHAINWCFFNYWFPGVITSYADRKAQEFDDAYTAARTQDALTKSYFANARKAGVAEDVSDSLANIFSATLSAKTSTKKTLETKF